MGLAIHSKIISHAETNVVGFIYIYIIYIYLYIYGLGIQGMKRLHLNGLIVCIGIKKSMLVSRGR